MTKKILVVDDSPQNIDLVIGALTPDYRIAVATSGQDALFLAVEEQPDLILLDVMMPEMNGYEVCQKLKQKPGTREIPVIFLTALHDDTDEAAGLELGAVDYISKPFNPELLRHRIRTQITLKSHREDLEQMVDQRTRMLSLTQNATIEIAGHIAEYRDPETGFHIQRTKGFVRCLAMGLAREKPGPGDPVINETYLELLTKSAPLHDIGKVGIPDSILMKPGKLTPEEFREMKQHTCYGKKIIEASETSLGADSFLGIARQIAYTHHERWDGTGYPQGLKGRDIPLAGRLMALADVYDALRTKRVYKPAFSHTKAARIIQSGRGTHFDPGIVDVFSANQGRFQEIASAFEDPGEDAPKPEESQVHFARSSAY